MLEIQVSLSDVKELGLGVWEGELSPSDVRRLGETNKNIGSVSIVALSGKPRSDQNRIQFDAQTATVLNVGSTS